MNNYFYELIFSEHILTLYGKYRIKCIDEELYTNYNKIHKYSIKDRIDLTYLETYTIDPEGCEDADDAFSIFYENNKLFLAIHIADPTEYIDIESNLWKDIQEKIISKYPSNRKPIHMMPEFILNLSSLKVNELGNIKLAITIITEINQETFLPINKIKLFFSKIKLKEENTLSYLEASNKINDIKELEFGIKISKILQEERSKKTIGVKLNHISTSIIKFNNNYPFLYNNSTNEKLMKDMIGEFAIFANSFIGYYLKINLNDNAIFRTCNAFQLINNDLYKNLNGNELLKEIIINGINADYIDHSASHDLIGTEQYTHFTSPIRRVSDCVCHYLLKYLYFKNINYNIQIPFKINKLKNLSDKCTLLTKEIKKIQYKDNKFRLIQVINKMLYNNKIVKLSYYISCYKSHFLNIIINKINHFNVYISYSLIIDKFNYNKHDKNIYNINITRVNCPGKYDSGTIPELDNIFFSNVG